MDTKSTAYEKLCANREKAEQRLAHLREEQEAKRRNKEESLQEMHRISLLAMIKDAVGYSRATEEISKKQLYVAGTTAAGVCVAVNVKLSCDPFQYDWQTMRNIVAAAKPGELVYISIPVEHLGYYVSRLNARTLDIKDGTTSLKDRLFFSCTSLESITLPPTLRQIGDEVFKGCTSLREINFPPTLKEIGARAFAGCVALEGEIRLPPSVKRVGYDAFTDCPNIRRIVVQNAQAAFSTDLFATCPALIEIVSPQWTLVREKRVI